MCLSASVLINYKYSIQPSLHPSIHPSMDDKKEIKGGYETFWKQCIGFAEIIVIIFSA